MAWWQWSFFYLGVVTAFALALVLATAAFHLWRGAGSVLTSNLDRSSAAPKQWKPHDASVVTASEAPSSVISTEARVG
jgi:hypothetical protein